MNKELEDALGNLTQQAYNNANNEKQLQKDKEHYELIKKHLDALEIIREKTVNVNYLMEAWKFNEKNKDRPDIQISDSTLMFLAVKNLSQDELSLLKEVLYNESLQ